MSESKTTIYAGSCSGQVIRGAETCGNAGSNPADPAPPSSNRWFDYQGCQIFGKLKSSGDIYYYEQGGEKIPVRHEFVELP